MAERRLLIPTVCSDYYAPIQMPYGMRINQQKRHSVYLVAFSGQLPRFGEWNIDYQFEAALEARAPSGGVSPSSAPFFTSSPPLSAKP